VNIATCFGKLVNRLQPSDNEKALAQQHLCTIKNRLTATFNIRRFLTGGSFARGTFIRGGSDVDLFAVISKKDVTWGDGLVSSETARNSAPLLPTFVWKIHGKHLREQWSSFRPQREG